MDLLIIYIFTTTIPTRMWAATILNANINSQAVKANNLQMRIKLNKDDGILLQSSKNLLQNITLKLSLNTTELGSLHKNYRNNCRIIHETSKEYKRSLRQVLKSDTLKKLQELINKLESCHYVRVCILPSVKSISQHKSKSDEMPPTIKISMRNAKKLFLHLNPKKMNISNMPNIINQTSDLLNILHFNNSSCMNYNSIHLLKTIGNILKLNYSQHNSSILAQNTPNVTGQQSYAGHVNGVLQKSWCSNIRSVGRGKKNQWFHRVLPLLVLPFLIQSSVTPFLISKLQLLLFNSFLVGKLAILMLILTTLRNSYKFKQAYEVTASQGSNDFIHKLRPRAINLHDTHLPY